MTRTVIPFAASALLALIGLPAAAADLGDEGELLESTDESGVDSTLPAAEAAEQDRAERRGGGRKGGSRAQSGGKGGGQQAPAAANRGGGAHPAPAAHASSSARTLRAPAAGHAAQAPARPSAANVHRGATPARPAAAAQRSGSAAQRSGSAAQRSGSAAQRSGSAAHRDGSAAHRDGHESKPGTHHVQAGNGPRAANAHPSRGNGPSPKAPHRAASNKRAPHHVVHHSSGMPRRWSPAWHRYHIKGVPHYAPRYWGAGVFFYNPPPARHRVVVVDGAGNRVADGQPTRAVDRNNSFGVGLRGGSYMSGYSDGGGYGDLGMGLALRYRPAESLGLELSWMHHSDTWDDHAERAEDPISASVQLFAFPWTRVSPYALVGLTVTPREADDTYFNGLETVHYEANDALAGPHAGLGIEFAIGKSAAIGFEGKYIGYIDRQEGDQAFPGAFQGNMGLNMYF